MNRRKFKREWREAVIDVLANAGAAGMELADRYGPGVVEGVYTTRAPRLGCRHYADVCFQYRFGLLPILIGLARDARAELGGRPKANCQPLSRNLRKFR